MCVKEKKKVLMGLRFGCYQVRSLRTKKRYTSTGECVGVEGNARCDGGTVRSSSFRPEYFLSDMTQAPQLDY